MKVNQNFRIIIIYNYYILKKLAVRIYVFNFLQFNWHAYKLQNICNPFYKIIQTSNIFWTCLSICFENCLKFYINDIQYCIIKEETF